MAMGAASYNCLIAKLLDPLHCLLHARSKKTLFTAISLVYWTLAIWNALARKTEHPLLWALACLCPLATLGLFHTGAATFPDCAVMFCIITNVSSTGYHSC